MNLYTLPRNLSNFFTLPSLSETCPPVHFSLSLFKQYQNINKTFIEHSKKNTKESQQLLHYAHPFYLLVENTIAQPYLKSWQPFVTLQSTLLLSFIEIINYFHLFSSFSLSQEAFSILFCGTSLEDLQHFHSAFKENQNCNIHVLTNVAGVTQEQTDFIFCNSNPSDFQNEKFYILYLLHVLKLICLNLKTNGTIIITANHLFSRPVLDILFILTSVFDKVSIAKTQTSNPIDFEKFIICQGKKHNETLYNEVKSMIDISLLFYHEKYIVSFLPHDLPMYFVNKIDDFNVILGQQQLENINQMSNIIQLGNTQEKIEHLKKINFQKLQLWFDRNNVPFYNFFEKQNIFLAPKIENK